MARRADYYADHLSAERLRRCYEIATPRVRQYLRAEIEYVLTRIAPTDTVLELGCGYGRALRMLVRKARRVIGIDTSHASLQLAARLLADVSNCGLIEANAVAIPLQDGLVDCVVCIQNGISAFHVNRQGLVRECLRVTRGGGRVLMSSYSDLFWDARFEWFRLQSEEGLLGEIDRDATGDGVIVCKDGFVATTVGPDEFAALASPLSLKSTIVTVDESSVFCEIPVER